MRNKFLYRTGLSIVFASLVFASCEDDLQPDYPSPETKSNVSLSATSYALNEGGEVMITLNTDRVFNDDMTFKLEILNSSTAVDGEDFEIDLDHSNLDYANPDEDEYVITFPKYESSYSFAISAFEDLMFDPAETINFRLSPLADFNGNVSAGSEEFTVTINQSDDLLTFIFEWDQTFQFSGSDYTLCDIGYDNDFVYADSNYNLIDYIAGTAACPEVGQLSLSELGDGDFHIFQNVWDDGNLSSVSISPAFSIPVTTTFMKGNTLNGSYVQDAANAVDSDFGSDPNLNSPVYVVSFNISGTTVTMYDATTSTTIASGRYAKPQLKGLDKLKRRVK